MKMKRLLAMLLAVVMVLGLIPVSALKADAAGETIYVLAGGDFQEAGNHANSADNVNNILAQISNKYATMDGFLFVGDYDCETHNDATETANGINALMGAVQGTYSNLNHDNSILVQGNHDYMDSHIDATGGHDFDGYSVFVLNEDDYLNGGGSESGVQALANNMKEWLDLKLLSGFDDPIFVTSHLPLAFTPRTVTQGDAKYAKYLFDVMNEAAAEGLNIIFMHGHDHAYGPDNYIGGEAVYLAEGDTICIAKAGSQSEWTVETLNFTYMNAGYTGYYSDAFTYVTTAGTDKLTMTVFAITNGEVTVERYNDDGLYNLKSAGYNGSYSNTDVTASSLGLPFNDTVYTSPQSILLTTNSIQEDAGTIGNWVEVSAEEVTDDVTTSNKGWVELIVPIPGTPAIPATPESTKYVYTLDTDGTVTDKADAAQGYLIVGSGNASAMTDSLGVTGVTITDNAITLDAQPNYEWWIKSDGKITDGTNYLKFTQGGNYFNQSGTLSVVSSESDATTWTIAHNSNGAYNISAVATYSFMGNQRVVNFYLRYNSNGFSVTSSENTVRLFSGAKVTTPATEGTPATPDTNGTYGKIVGDLTYDATIGMTADEAMALVKAGIDGYYYDAMSTPGSNVTGTKVEDDVLTWEWVDTFNGNVAGDYEVAIKYGDFLLGTAEVVVPTQSTYYIAEGPGLHAVSMNTPAATAMAHVKSEISVYSATDANGANKTLIEDSEVTWTWVDTYDGTNNGPYTIDISVDGVSLGTVEVKVNVRYDSGLKGWTYVGDTEATGGTKVVTYELDTDGIDYGEEHKYIIVDDNEAIVLNAQSAANGTAHSITISGNTATLDTRDYEYHFIQTSFNGTRYELITKGDGSQYLYQEGYGVRYGTRSSVKFQVNHHGSGVYDIHDIDGDPWYIIYDGSWKVTATTSARVRLYKFVSEETVGGTGGGPQYVKLEGNTLYSVAVGTSSTAALNKVKEGLTAYISSSEDGSNATELNDSLLSWTFKNSYNGNITGSYFVEVKYNGYLLGTVEVVVEPGYVDNYPEYPSEGAVKVNKTATGIDFQASGVAQIEVSASGVPSKKGADVILMLDTSSSMINNTVTGSSKSRAQVLEESLANLIAQFKTPGEDGELLDIRVAIADFNGFYTSTTSPYYRDGADTMSDDISYPADSEAKVYTGDGTLSAGAFIPAGQLAASYTLNYTSGTNYDYAFDAIYQMGSAIKAYNEANGEERDLYVIFMSDGAAMQWNYYHSQGASSLWNNWITGAWAANELTTANLNCTEHAYYYDEVDHNGDGMLNEHRMANAVKGDPNQLYEVIRKTKDLGDPTGETNMYMVPGLGATMFSISFDAQADTNVTEESMDKSIETLASEGKDANDTTQYYYKVTSAEELDEAFRVIGAEIAYAATNARFVDQMGDNFNLQLGNLSYLPTGVNDESMTQTIVPYIEILSYDIWTRAEYENKECTIDKIGVRKGSSTQLELVAFNADGTKAYSNQIDVDKDGVMGLSNVTKNADGTYSFTIDEDDNIMDANQVIYAKTFYYNASQTSVALTGVEIPVSVNSDGTTSATTTNLLPSETFYWKLGTVQSSELAMRYFVYLEGALEGRKPAGSYATNEFATLYYDNYLGNSCLKDTVSPQIGWKEANVSYAFYLVNANGEVITNQATGATGTFANKIAITNPVVYDTINLNAEDELRALEVAAIKDDVLPKYYTLYDNAAVYKVHPNSNSTGYWEITKSDDVPVASTYVTNHTIGTAYSNATYENDTAYDYTHTVVWFAVVWTVEAHPDTVVVDYGLPVDIDVLSNDMFGSAGKLDSISNTIPWKTNADGSIYYNQYGSKEVVSGNFETPDASFSPSITTEFGTAHVDVVTNKVTYQLSTAKGMKMDTFDQFAYAVQYTGTSNAGYYYDVVTVVPATTIYYEESFLTFSGSGTSWQSTGSAVTGLKQDEDRPGQYSLSDANNIYGYDSVNLSMSQYSLGTAKKVTVSGDAYATATFNFVGTGFDVISMTSSDTGVLAVEVLNANGETEVAKVVDTYYGAQYNEETGKWELVEDGAAGTPNQIWQVPVMQVSNLPYGAYTVIITATYVEPFDHTAATGYDLYLDAIRIYDPAGTEYGTDDSADGTAGNLIDSEIQSAYAADGERWPVYCELRNMILGVNSFDDDANKVMDEDMVGVVFIDGDAEVGDDQIADYASYGPNNEIYLAPGQSVAFVLSDAGAIDNVHLGLSSADGKAVTYTITNIAQADIANSTVTAGDYYNARTFDDLNTTTDMYYDITDWKGDIVVVSNTGDRYGTAGVLALSNIKITHTADPNGATAVDDEPAVYMTRSAAALTLRSLSAAEPVEDTIGSGNVVETPDTEDTVTGGTTTPESGNTGSGNTTGTTGTTGNGNNNTDTEDTVTDTTEPETGVTDNNANGTTTDTDTDKTEGEDAPATDDATGTTGSDDTTVEEEQTEEPGFWAKLWNGIKNAFNRLLSWLGL